jgi:hypothetical protein
MLFPISNTGYSDVVSYIVLYSNCSVKCVKVLILPSGKKFSITLAMNAATESTDGEIQ